MVEHTEDTISRLACDIADYTYEKYKAERYGLKRCPSEYSEDDVKDKILIKFLLENYNDHFYCNIEKIKSLT